MMQDSAQEIARLRAALAEREAELASARAELTGARLLIERYRLELAALRRQRFGASSEKLDGRIAQLELLLEDLEEGEAAAPARGGPDRPRRNGPGYSRSASPCRRIYRVRMWCIRRAMSAPAVAVGISRPWARM